MDLPERHKHEYQEQCGYFWDTQGLSRNLRDVLEDQEVFEHLKDDLYDGVIDTCRDDHPDGFKRMRATLAASIRTQLTASVITQFPTLIQKASQGHMPRLDQRGPHDVGGGRMNARLFNSSSETSARLLMALPIINLPASLDEITATDLVATYMQFFGYRNRNLHGDNEFTLAEYGARRARVEAGLKQIVRLGYALSNKRQHRSLPPSLQSISQPCSMRVCG
ncbi:ABC-three component system protein [Corynebacterium sp. CCM 9203]|uniref:ABC-three component system protein n=1 Tax=Corynebacterium sp. CCM 9203 TaxID=3057615 RepID=UPI003525E507